MENPSLLEECYKKFSLELDVLIPEGIYFLDLELLHRLDLLHFQPDAYLHHPLSAHVFHVIESAEKMTLWNDEFIIWIATVQNNNRDNRTQVLIALNSLKKEPKLEAALYARGIYNTTKLILRVLDKFLFDIRETERMLSYYRKTG
jgi:hypothetical protein